MRSSLLLLIPSTVAQPHVLRVGNAVIVLQLERLTGIGSYTPQFNTAVSDYVSLPKGRRVPAYLHRDGVIARHPHARRHFQRYRLRMIAGTRVAHAMIFHPVATNDAAVARAVRVGLGH